MDFDYYFNVMYEGGPLPLKTEPTYTTTGTSLLEAMSLLEEVEKTLLIKRKDFKLKMKILDFKMNTVNNKQNQLKETMLKFNKFVQENDYKKWRAETRISEERKTIASLTHDIQQAEIELVEMGRFKEKLLRWTKKCHIYFDFVMKVHLLTSYDFPELRHIIARKETLLSIQEELVTCISNHMDGCEEVKNKLKKFIEDQHDLFIHLNLELMSLKEKRQAFWKLIYDWNIKQTDNTHKTLDAIINTTKIILCINSMCDQLAQYKGRQALPRLNNLHACIRAVPMIANHVVFFGAVVARVKKEFAAMPTQPSPCDN